MPDRYDDVVPWGAVKTVERKGQSVRLKITDGQRFGRKPTLFYRMFPEQARYKYDDVQIVDCNRTDHSAAALVALIEGHINTAERLQD